MYYFKSDPRQLSLKPKMSGFVFPKKTAISAKKTYPLSNIKLNENIKNRTAPLMLFVNLLMKHGKKTHALRVLDQTLYIFKANISKIKKVPDKHSFVYYQRFNYSKPDLNNTFSRNLISDYNIKLLSKALIFFKKGKAFISSDFTKYILYLNNSRKVFPFFYNFFSFTDFYISKRFFRGKFCHLNQRRIKLNTSELAIFSKKNYPEQFKLRNYKNFSKKNTLFCKPNQTHNRFSEKYLWYKNPVRNSSWDKLTVKQKNTFLHCLYQAISNVKPPLECRTKRIGGSNKQIPSQIAEHRQWGLAIRWIIEAACFLNKKSQTIGKAVPRGQRPLRVLYQNNKKEEMQNKSKYAERIHNKTKATAFSKTSLKEPSSKTKFYRFCFSLAESLENAYYKKGPAMHKRNVWIDTALANRAFLRYRWW